MRLWWQNNPSLWLSWTVSIPNLVSILWHATCATGDAKLLEGGVDRCRRNMSSEIITTWASHRYVKLRVAHAPGMPGMFFPPPRVSNLDMHHGTCVTHVPWGMPRSLNSGFLWSRWGENVPGIPSACTTCNFTHLARGPYARDQLVRSASWGIG